MKTHPKSHLAGSFALVTIIGALAVPNSVFALGIALPDQDAFATARGNAFTATADDPAAVFYNPAGISQLEGQQFSLNAYSIIYGDTYKGAAGKINSQEQWETVPQVFSSMSFPKYNLTFGLGTYSPYGLRFEWPSSAPFSPAGQMGEIDYIRLNPVIAWQVIPSLSIAAGPMLDYSEANLKQTVGGFNNEFRGRDTDAGYNIGVLWKPWAQHSFGITYRSESDMNYKGHATSLTGLGYTAAQANFHLPETLVFGYSFRPTTNWNFEADATWADWTTIKTVYEYPGATAPTPLSALDTLAFNWHPSWMFDFGATRYLGKGWRVSGGYMYVENTIPDGTFNPLVPDSDRHIFSIGVGKKYNKFSWDVAYQLAWGPSRTVSDDNFPPADGSYTFLSHAISINFGYKF